MVVKIRVIPALDLLEEDEVLTISSIGRGYCNILCLLNVTRHGSSLYFWSSVPSGGWYDFAVRQSLECAP